MESHSGFTGVTKEKILSLKGIMSSDLMVILNNIEEPGRLADLVVSNLQLKTAESQSVLEINDPVARLQLVSEYLNKELEVSAVQAKIQSEAKEEMGKTQREYYLREQLQALKKELGDSIDLSRLFSPIGLKIGGDSAVEIALSIAAEINNIKHSQ